MANSKFIKVTPKGEKEARIVLASLKPFYISQGAKIETPTDEEVWAAEPSERPAGAVVTAQKEQKDLRGEIASYKAVAERNAKAVENLKAELEEVRKNTQATVKELEEMNAEKDKTIAEQAEAIAGLRESLAASEATVKESEQVIAELQNKLAAKKAKAAE